MKISGKYKRITAGELEVGQYVASYVDCGSATGEVTGVGIISAHNGDFVYVQHGLRQTVVRVESEVIIRTEYLREETD